MTGKRSPPTESLSLSQLKRIDELCDEFEEAWQEDGPADLGSFRARGGTLGSQPAKQRLLCNLIVLDLEYRWRDRQRVSELPEAAPPLLEDYAAELAGVGPMSQEQHLELITSEYQARHRWGDHPPFEQYAARFPQYGGGLKLTLHKALAELTPTRLRVYQSRQLSYSILVTVPVELGRQRRGEPGPYCQLETPDGSRIVIAPVDEKQISRAHLRVELVSIGKLRLTNLSDKNAISIGCGVRLDPHQSSCEAIPVLLGLADRAVRVEEA